MGDPRHRALMSLLSKTRSQRVSDKLPPGRQTAGYFSYDITTPHGSITFERAPAGTPEAELEHDRQEQANHERAYNAAHEEPDEDDMP